MAETPGKRIPCCDENSLCNLGQVPLISMGDRCLNSFEDLALSHNFSKLPSGLVAELQLSDCCGNGWAAERGGVMHVAVWLFPGCCG